MTHKNRGWQHGTSFQSAYLLHLELGTQRRFPWRAIFLFGCRIRVFVSDYLVPVPEIISHQEYLGNDRF